MTTPTTTSQQPTTTRQKARQFVRNPAAVPPLGAWTERDEEIIRAVALNRFVTTEQLHFLVGGSLRKLQIRLRSLFHHDYLARPKTQLQLWQDKRRSFVYALGEEGAKRLRGKGASIVGEKNPRYWTRRNLAVRHAHIFHTLNITSFHVSLVRAAREQDMEVFWQREGEALRDYTYIKNQRGKPVRIPINPDALFSLAWTKAGKRRTRWCALEVDLGTEPNEREDIDRGTDVKKKLLAYWQWGYRYRKHLTRWKIPKGGFVVLVATSSKTRMDNLLRVAKTIDTKQQGSNMFWFTTFNPHQDYASLLSPIWTSPNGKTHSLTE